jgi:hypothetical protein
MFDQPKMKVLPDGSKEWLLRGKLHREDGPAREDADGTKNWCLNGKLHRIDGPAVEWDDRPNEWFLNGKRHRSDGPALERADGSKMWFLNGNEVSWQEVFRQANDPEIELRILSYVDNLLT